MKIRKIISGNEGGIFVLAAAIVVSIVAFFSSSTLIEIAVTDYALVQYEHDKIQEELLLRTELTRTKLKIDDNKYLPLPPREVKIYTDTRRTKYSIENHKEPERTGYSVQSKVNAARQRENGRFEDSPIVRMTERYLNPKSLAEYQYITQTEESENADGGSDASLVKFYGPDTLYGPVHSNSDIWLQDLGGYPTFYDMVTTTGRFRDYNNNGAFFSPDELDQICLGGWEEEVPYVGFSPTADDIKRNGIILGNDASDIVYIELQNGNFNSLYGNIVETEVQELDVFSWFPGDEEQAQLAIDNGINWYEDADLIWTNEITMLDTVWTPGPSMPTNNNSFWIPHGELWIKGVVSGSTTFGCADTVFVVGDITYSGTAPGNHPDGFSGIVGNEPTYDDPVNNNDYFGLVSEQKILIRYKHKDPLTNEIIDDNCSDVYMYGAYAAIAEGDEALYGDMACHYDGIFTFQYHHMHGSTPDFRSWSPFITYPFTIELNDAGNDGWDGASVDVIVDGELVLDDITCNGGQINFEFDVDNGDIIETQFTSGGSDDECSYTVFDQEDNIVMQDGPNPLPNLASPMMILPPTNTDTLYTYVDLHKFVFPQSSVLPPGTEGFNLHGAAPIGATPCGYPIESLVNNGLIDPNGYILSFPNAGGNYAFPYGTDYPWYNPVWPEPSSAMIGQFERGYIRIYGAVAQRRRGFVHRSGNDPYNHPQGGDSPSPWEMDQYHFDGDHPSTGYDKDYYYDQRFLTTQPPDFPQIHENWGQHQLAGFVQKSWYFKSPDDWGL